MKSILYNLSQHYYEAQSNIPTGKVSMNKILENAHLCLTFLPVHCEVSKETDSFVYKCINMFVCLSTFIFRLSIEMLAQSMGSCS